MNNTRIGMFIAAIRKEQKMTQEQLAEKLGVSNRSVSRWENGNSAPDLAMMQKLCRELDVSIAELINGERKNTKSESEDSAILVMELADRDKERKAKRLNLCFFFGLLFILFVTCYEMLQTSGAVKEPFLENYEIALLLGMGFAFELAGFYYNTKGSKANTFTSREIEALTTDEQALRMKTAEEMLQIARKYQKAEFKQYKLAFEEIAKSLAEDEYTVFSMVADSYTIDDSPGPWHISLAVTNKRVILCGETVRGRLLTRQVMDSFDRSEICYIKLVNRKLILKTSKNTIKITGENFETIIDKMRAGCFPFLDDKER